MAKPGRSGLAGLAKEKELALCQHARQTVGHGLNPTGRMPKMAAMSTRAIRLTITWQCDMVVNTVGRVPAVRHSYTEPVKQTERPIFSEREPTLTFAICCRLSVYGKPLWTYLVTYNAFYSTMPRPLGPVKRAGFFSECTLTGLQLCINQPG